jgi:hypothetical protein
MRALTEGMATFGGQAFWTVSAGDLQDMLCRGVARDALRLRKKLSAKGRVVQVTQIASCQCMCGVAFPATRVVITPSSSLACVSVSPVSR